MIDPSEGSWAVSSAGGREGRGCPSKARGVHSGLDGCLWGHV